MSTATLAPAVSAPAAPSKQIPATPKPPLKKYRVLHGTHTQDDPRFAHYNFRAPAGAADSPWEADQMVPTANGIQIVKTPRLPLGHPDSPYNQDGARKSHTFISQVYAAGRAEQYGTPPPGPDYKDDIFESPFDMVAFDREKYALVTDPYADETPADRMARLRAELAQLEAEEAARAAGPAPAAGADDLDEMTETELRKEAAGLKIDLSKAKNRKEMAETIRKAIQAK